MRELSLYFHIPYCKHKCFYCDFNSYSNRSETIELYFDSLLKEIDLYEGVFDSRVSTMFFGGGTPSIVSPQYIDAVINSCTKKFSFSKDIEITIESNPDSLNLEKLQQYKSSGINRLSIGLQAWQNKLLKRIGRIHNREQFQKGFEYARSADFNNINVDLMFSLPSQALNDWEETINEVAKLSPEHLSCYSLKVEEGTKIFEDNEKGLLSLPDDETDRHMYHKTKEILMNYGYHRYEVSNFAKLGLECRHNLTYWTFKEYIGFGISAHSFYNNCRFENVCNLEEYISTIKKGILPFIEKNALSIDDRISEYIITGLRLTEGIKKEEFYNRFNVEIESFFNEKVKKYIQYGLIENNQNAIRLTDLGIDLSNTILCEFV